MNKNTFLVLYTLSNSGMVIYTIPEVERKTAPFRDQHDVILETLESMHPLGRIDDVIFSFFKLLMGNKT